MKWHLAALAAVATLGIATPALADSITLHGMWNDRPQGKSSKSSGFSLFGGPSYLGATPKLAAYNPYTLRALPPAKPVELADGGERPAIKPKEPELVELVSHEFSSEYGPGSIVVDTAKRKLFYILSPQLAYSYPIAVGKEGFSWTGTETVSKVVEWPEWMPPEEMRERKPTLPIRMTGGLQNPLGARAIYLGKTLYRIHGTNDPGSIGSASSSGCFRMHNKHVAHLAGLVTVKQTRVYVLKSVPKGTWVQWKTPAKEKRKSVARSI